MWNKDKWTYYSLSLLLFQILSNLLSIKKEKGIAMILFQKLKLLCPQKSFCDCTSVVLGSSEKSPIWPFIIFLHQNPPGRYQRSLLPWIFIMSHLNCPVLKMISRFNHLLLIVWGRHVSGLSALYVPSGLLTGEQCLFSPIFSKSWD